MARTKLVSKFPSASLALLVLLRRQQSMTFLQHVISPPVPAPNGSTLSQIGVVLLTALPSVPPLPLLQARCHLQLWTAGTTIPLRYRTRSNMLPPRAEAASSALMAAALAVELPAPPG